jgi:hypothetical protein
VNAVNIEKYPGTKERKAVVDMIQHAVAGFLNVASSLIF